MKVILTWLSSLMLAFFLAGRAGAQSCYESSILSPSPFMGNDGEIFKLADGSIWEVKYEYEYLYEYYPSVIICPNRGKLNLGKKSLNVQQVSGAQTRGTPPKGSRSTAANWGLFEETNLVGSISGTVQQGRVLDDLWERVRSGGAYIAACVGASA